MSDPLRSLLKGADLPWWEGPSETEHSRRIYAPTDGVNLASTWWDGNPHPTAALIVTAVNALPRLLDRLDAINQPGHRIVALDDKCAVCNEPIYESNDYRGGRFRHESPEAEDPR